MAACLDDDYQVLVTDYHEPIWLKGLRDPLGLLMGAFMSSKIVENCEVNIDDDLLDVPKEALMCMTSISHLNGLKSIRLLPDKFNKIYSFRIDLLTTALRGSCQLEMLSVCGLDLSGSEDEFSSFLSALQSHPSLRLLRLIRCRLPENSSLLDRLIASLSRVKKLHEVELSGAEESMLGDMSNESWTLLHRFPSLEKFRLDNFLLPEQHMLESFRALEQNNRLKTVNVASCELGTGALDAMAQMLHANNCLEDLSVCLIFNEFHSCKDEVLTRIAQSLEGNSKLRHFRLSGSNRWPKCSDRVQESFLQTLHRNSTLETLFLFDRTDLLREIDFFLALNRMGRKRLMDENATRKDCLFVIERSKCSLDCLFYFLSMKPELLDSAV